MKTSPIRPIRNDDDHAKALGRIEQLMDAQPGSDEFDELEVLAQLVSHYESIRWPIDLPDPVQAIQFRMDQAGLARRDLVPYLGSASKVSEVLNGKLGLSLKMIRALNKHLGIPAEVLLGNTPTHAPDPSHPYPSDRYPIKEMETKGWFEAMDSKEGGANAAIQWLERQATALGASLPDIASALPRSRCNSQMSSTAFRAWLLRVMSIASQQSLQNPFEPGTITTHTMRQLATLSLLPNGPKRAQEFLAQFGIRVVHVESLKRTYLDSAALLLPDGSPVIALTFRNQRMDNFWFQMLHALAHIKNDLINPCDFLVDDFSISANARPHELRADTEAKEALVPSEYLPEAVTTTALDKSAILAIAKKAHVHPAIVVGRLQQDSGNWRKFAKLAVREDMATYFV